MKNEQSYVRLHPWIGERYTEPGDILRQRTLILGGSQYSEGYESFHENGGHAAWAGFTNEVVEYYFDSNIKGTWKRTYSTFINSIFGRPTNEDERVRFFDSVVFYNYLQEIAGDTPTDAGKFDYRARDNFIAFREILEEHRPEVVISWGAKVWDALPNNWDYGPATISDPVIIDGKSAGSVYSYPFQDQTIRLVGVHHPSSGYGRMFHHDFFRRLDLLR